ncbi:hypothetical protein [Candidatus Albibeggiatoa sp. nov. NOAA]|uniref:hypothetical protein n=1 Tax=Candidatus Albibeggiatoa sp. nov. NOAA TaxID=3162724 RepID=UPI0032F2A90E|nr:hypothetical protein [Thiotrichaceae bacterium]
MVRRNIVLASAIAGVLGVPSAAYAGIDLTSDSPSPVTVISQLSDSEVTLEEASDTGTIYAITADLGKDVDVSGDEKFVRFDLDAGATFSGSTTLALVSVVSATANNIDVTLSGGGSGESFVIFSIKNNDDSVLDSSSDIQLKFESSSDGIKVDGASSDVNVTYSVYRTALDSTKGTGSSLYSETAEYIEFKPVFTFSTTESTLTADVENNFLQFTTGNTYGQLASISLDVDSDVYLTDGSAATAINQVLDSGDGTNTITVNGDFSSLADSDGAYDVSRLFLTTNSGCADGYDFDNGASTTTSLTAEKAVMDLPIASTASPTYYLCIQRDTNSEVEYVAAEYNLDFDVDPTGTGVEIANYEAQKAGKIERNGTILDTPFFTNTDGSISRVILSNFGTNDANFTVTVQSDEGTTVTPGSVTSGTVAAGTIFQIKGSDLASFEGKQRGSAKFTIVATPDSMSGVYQTVNLTTGAVTSIKLIHEGGNH